MTYDPSAARSGAVSTTNRVFQAAWICYINGVEVPIMGFEVQYGVWRVPEFSIDLVPDILLQRLGYEDRIPVQIFYLDYWVDPENPEFRLLVDGEIVGWRYTSSFGNRSMRFNCTAHIHVFQQLYFFYMTNVDDIVESRAPENGSMAFNTAGLLYPYSLFHQGLIVTPSQVTAARPATRRPGRRDAPLPAAPNLTVDDAEKPTIQAPYELISNVIKGTISKDVPANRRAVPMMNFFARHMRKTRFHNRFVRLPYLEDPEVIGDQQGVFPIFQAARSTEALNAMQRQTASQIGNSGPVWNVLEQIYSMVHMEIAMIPNPAAVFVDLDGEPTEAAPRGVQRDGNIRNVLSSNAAIVSRPVTVDQADNQARAEALASVLRGDLANEGVPVPEAHYRNAGFTVAPTEYDQIDVNRIIAYLRTQQAPPAEASGPARDPAEPTALNEGTDPKTPIRLAQYFVKPQFYFGIPPHCNVIFPSMVDSWSYDEPYLTQPTRVYVNDSVMTQMLRATGSNRNFMLHALTVAFPEEANAVMEHKTGGPNLDAAGVNSESGKNLLIWPEEFYKGPVTAKFDLPAWFQMLRQFSNGGNTNPNTPPVPPIAVNTAVVGDHSPTLFGGVVEDPRAVPGRLFHSRGGRHAGVDFMCAQSIPAYAIYSGVVFKVSRNFEIPETGNTVWIRHPRRGTHGEDLYCVYQHLATIGAGIVAGAAVTPHQEIGTVGQLNGTKARLDGGSYAAGGRTYNLPDTLAIFGLATVTGTGRNRVRTVDPIVAEAQAARTVDECLRLLEPRFRQEVVPPRGANLLAWPWDTYLARNTVSPGVTEPGWRGIARAIGGFFIDSPPHCHFEIIENRGANPLRSNSEGHVDPVEFLIRAGIAFGTGLGVANPEERRGRPRQAPGAPATPSSPTGGPTHDSSDTDTPPVPADGTPGTPTVPATPATTPPGSPATVPLPGMDPDPQAPPPTNTTPGPVTPPVPATAQSYRDRNAAILANRPPPVVSEEQLLIEMNFELQRQGWNTVADSPENRARIYSARDTEQVRIARLNAERLRFHLPTTTLAEVQNATDTATVTLLNRALDDFARALTPAAQVEQQQFAQLRAEDRTLRVNQLQRAQQDRLRREQPEPPATTPAPVTPPGTPPAGSPPSAAAVAREKSFQKLFEIYARYEYLRQRYTVRQSVIQMRFNPYLVPGFPSMMFDSMRTRFHTVGYMQNISHSASAGGGGSISTQVQQTCCRTFPEFVNDVRYDSERFVASCIAAPAEIIDNIRNRIQDVQAAEAFYIRLFYGEGQRYSGAPTAFRWTEALEYSRAGGGDAIVHAGQDTADAATEDLNAETSDEVAAATADRRILTSNLDPDRELSPRENYQKCFDSYDIAMQKCSRPVCTLEQFVRFWHAGMTLNDLIGQGIVTGTRELFAYTSAPTTDVTGTRAEADGTSTNVRGATSRPGAVYYDRIFKLRVGPGEDLPAPEGSPGNHLKPPTDPEQGFTTPTTTNPAIQPTQAHAGVSKDYPQTRANWDSVLEQYRDKVRIVLRPNV